jgi:hypothetical protein
VVVALDGGGRPAVALELRRPLPFGLASEEGKQEGERVNERAGR